MTTEFSGEPGRGRALLPIGDPPPSAGALVRGHAPTGMQRIPARALPTHVETGVYSRAGEGTQAKPDTPPEKGLCL